MPFNRDIFSFGPEKKIWRELSEAEHQRYPGDYEAQKSQGDITEHSVEHLATSDRGVVMLRRLYKEQAEIVARGGNPRGVAFDEKDALFQLASGVCVTPAPVARTG